MKVTYKFSHRSDDGKTYYWISKQRVAGSLVDEVQCNVEWFWNQQGTA